MDHVQDNTSTYQEFKYLIQARSNNRAMLERFKTYLQWLLSDSLTKNIVSRNNSIVTLVSTLKQNYAKTPTFSQFEDTKIEVLENAVSGMIWPHNPIDRLHVDWRTCEDFYQALANSLQKGLKEAQSVRGIQTAGQRGIFFKDPGYTSEVPCFHSSDNGSSSRGYPPTRGHQPPPFGQSFKPGGKSFHRRI